MAAVVKELQTKFYEGIGEDGRRRLAAEQRADLYRRGLLQ
jgi:hypothetical protein